MKIRFNFIILILCFLFLTACNERTIKVTEASDEDLSGSVQQTEVVEEKEESDDILKFVDAHGNSYETSIRSDVPKHDYNLTAFKKEGYKMSYEGDPRYRYRLGVDVSYHEGELDWKAIKDEGFEFVILRIAARGYGKEGRVFLDKMFHHNIQAAQEAGLDVGVYFFSQAINEEEAKEEAEFVLENLEGYELELPVVYDPESILDDEARTDDVTGEQFTKNTLVFCNMVEAAGFQPMIYSNMLWEAYKFDLSQLTQYPIWYADYEDVPQTPYYFSMWQYSEKGYIDAVKDNEGKNYVDLDIQLIPVDTEESELE